VYTLRPAAPSDLDFLVEVDRLDEGLSIPILFDQTPEEIAGHREKIVRFVTDEDHAAWVIEEDDDRRLVAMILVRFRERRGDESASQHILFGELGDVWLPANGRFGEVFQLWVAPDCRRRGFATQLKNQFEQETQRRGIGLLYTHTETINEHVRVLNLKLGYREIRRGPLWDDVERVSMVKQLG
jgi:GNAT superfamily N-acetyltransferase